MHQPNALEYKGLESLRLSRNWCRRLDSNQDNFLRMEFEIAVCTLTESPF